jgi:hypothetical protein
MFVVARRADKNRVILFNGTNESPVPKCHLTHCAPKRLTVTVVSRKSSVIGIDTLGSSQDHFDYAGCATTPFAVRMD